MIWLWNASKKGVRGTAVTSSASSEADPNELTARVKLAPDLPITDAAAALPEKSTRAVRDRKRRDEMRLEIYQALGETPPTHSNPLAPSASAREAGVLDPEYVQKHIQEDFLPLAKECYEAALERDASIAGRLVLSFSIVGDDAVGGIVEAVESTKDSNISEKELVYCIRESMLSMTFEPPENGGTVSVVFPFVLNPGGPPDATAGEK